MVSLEQVKLLESKVTQAVDYVKKITGENRQLYEKLTSYQKRIEELEVLVQQFQENQSRIEDGILSALDRLNQFEDALESKLSTESKISTESKSSQGKKETLKEEPAKHSAEAAGLDRRSAGSPPAEKPSKAANGELEIF